jgi:hypothetical protein
VKAIKKITGKNPAYRFAGALSLSFLSSFLLFFQSSIGIKDPNNALYPTTFLSIYTLISCIPFILANASPLQHTHLALRPEPKHRGGTGVIFQDLKKIPVSSHISFI